MRIPISRPLLNLCLAAVLAAASCLSPEWMLVHSVFAESSGWNGVALRRAYSLGRCATNNSTTACCLICEGGLVPPMPPQDPREVSDSLTW